METFSFWMATLGLPIAAVITNCIARWLADLPLSAQADTVLAFVVFDAIVIIQGDEFANHVLSDGIRINIAAIYVMYLFLGMFLWAISVFYVERRICGFLPATSKPTVCFFSITCCSAFSINYYSGAVDLCKRLSICVQRLTYVDSDQVSGLDRGDSDGYSSAVRVRHVLSADARTSQSSSPREAGCWKAFYSQPFIRPATRSARAAEYLNSDTAIEKSSGDCSLSFASSRS